MGAIPLLLCGLLVPLPAANLPEGAELQARLTTRLSSTESKKNDRVEAVIIAPALDAERKVIVPARAILRGKVKEVKAAGKAQEAQSEDPAQIEVQFTELVDSKGGAVAIAARLTAIDNARETVDEKGHIVGIMASKTLSDRLDQNISKVKGRFGEFLSGIKQVMMKAPDPEIVYEPGVEFTIQLTKPLEYKGAADSWRPPEQIANIDALTKMVVAQPFRTTAETKPPRPSDMTNLMFLGTAEQVKAAFEASGWNTAAQLDATSALETIRAVAEERGYKEAPMSILLLEGERPIMDWQKQNNTFAKRHHLRIWRRPGEFEGRPIWVCAATHDIAIEFSPDARTFIHKIDSRVDLERAKVSSDLILGGHVKAMSLVPRPGVPTKTGNATGDAIETDGAMAVLILE